MSSLKELIESAVKEILRENKYHRDNFPSFEQWMQDSDSLLLDPDVDEAEIFEAEEAYDEWIHKYENFNDLEVFYRCLSVADISEIDLSNLGKYWTDYSSHNSCYLSKEKSLAKFIVAAVVPMEIIDWEETLEANMSSFYEENEITLRPGGEIRILYIKDEQGKKHTPLSRIGVV